MSDIIPNSVSMSKLMDNLQYYKRSPIRVWGASVDFLDEVLQGKVDIVDGTNPFMMLFGCSAAHMASACNESFINMRRTFPSLAQTDDDIYRHLTDKEYIGRFALPSDAPFTFNIPLSDINNKLVYDATEDCYKVTIPRDTYVVIDGHYFTMEYPIVIRRYNNGVVEIAYDNQYAAPLSSLTTNRIVYEVRTNPDQSQWLSFSVRIKQLRIESTNTPVSLSSIFNVDLQFANQFVYARVFTRGASTTAWTEIHTTHSDQVFDNNTLTALLKVTDGNLNVSIPYIYSTLGMLSGVVRVDLYTTEGALLFNMSNFAIPAFSTELRAIDESRDVSAYTNAWADMTLYTYSAATTEGGSNGVAFDVLKERVVQYATGPQDLPITNIESQVSLENFGFELVKNVDTYTNRIFLALRKLPAPVNTKVVTPANLGIVTFVADIDVIKDVSTVVNNGERLTLLSQNLFKITNGVTTLVLPSEIAALKALPVDELISTVNAAQYGYTPYYYVLDLSSNEFAMRPYDLDTISATNLSFLRQNQTLQLSVNTGSYVLAKTPQGYKLTIVVRSGQFYKQMVDNSVFVQLAFYPTGESFLAYINGTQIGLSSDGERIFEFLINTNYDVNSSDEICVTNASIFGPDVADVYVALTSKFFLLHSTTSITPDFQADETDALINKTMLPLGAVGNVEESLTLSLGQTLERLWTRTRTLASGLEYKVYDQDYPDHYEADVFAINPETGSILFFDSEGKPFTTKLHSAGDVVYSDGEVVYKYRKGDTVILNGAPVVVGPLKSKHELDLLVVDGKMFFVTDSVYVAYKDEIRSVLTNWITEGLEDYQAILLEETFVYFHPESSLGETKIIVEDDAEKYVQSEQTLYVDYYVGSTIMNDTAVQNQIRTKTITIIDDIINLSKFTAEDVRQALKDNVGANVSSLEFWGLGGDANYRVIQLSSEQNKLAIRKKLVAQSDGTIIAREDVNINFKLF